VRFLRLLGGSTVRSEDSSTRRQYSAEQGPVQNEYRTKILRTEKIAGEQITEKNPGARKQDREDNVFSLRGVKLYSK
jgi:hypothetical protein